MGSAYGTPPTCKGIFSMAAAQATGWHAMSDSAADDFRKENYIIADIIVLLEAPGGSRPTRCFSARPDARE